MSFDASCAPNERLDPAAVYLEPQAAVIRSWSDLHLQDRVLSRRLESEVLIDYRDPTALCKVSG
jgi:hypothetical protein